MCVFLFGGNKSFQVNFWSLVFFVFLVEGMCFSFFPPTWIIFLLVSLCHFYLFLATVHFFSFKREEIRTHMLISPSSSAVNPFLPFD